MMRESLVRSQMFESDSLNEDKDKDDDESEAPGVGTPNLGGRS